MTRYTETQSEKVQRIKRRIEQVEAKREANGEHSPPEGSEHLVIEARRLKTLLHELTHEPSREGLGRGGRQRNIEDTAKRPRGEDTATTRAEESTPLNLPSER